MFQSPCNCSEEQRRDERHAALHAVIDEMLRDGSLDWRVDPDTGKIMFRATQKLMDRAARRRPARKEQRRNR
jgi:hypothetical protein